ncbi:MAG TPA: hypothetical protein VFB06_19905 [Streptosporangiaceae bacterium]|nr:hypothetical protein [Streptosporangiaceae bacterium]
MTSLPTDIAAFDADLRRILTTCPTNERAAEIAAFTRRYSERDPVTGIVGAVCASSNMLVACAGKSVRHPLGFDKFVLHSADLYQLRLHVWWPGEAHDIEHIHNHRFSFVSGIIAGQISVASYRLERHGVPHTRFRETKDPVAGRYAYRPSGPVEATLASLQTLCTGCAYYLDSGELHRVQAAGGGLAATLFIRFPRNRENTDVLVAANGALPVTGWRETMGVDETRRRLGSFASMMSAA